MPTATHAHTMPAARVESASSGRRALLGLLGGGAAAGVLIGASSPALASDNPDAELIALCADFENLERRVLRLYDPASPDYTPNEDQRAIAESPLVELQDLKVSCITRLHATTLEGVAARAKAALAWAPDLVDDDQRCFDDRLIAALLRDLAGVA